MIVFGFLGLVVSSFGEPIFHWGFLYGGFVTMILGVVAVLGSRNAGKTVWAVVLIIVGAIGGGIGGLLVLLGGILGLISAIDKGT
ncbi:MAG: hypothetical protein LUO79_05250 [Methanomassiliicoccales archaeon]|nr:hypothetical protein [Methanomassiliicoccales archaeon]